MNDSDPQFINGMLEHLFNILPKKDINHDDYVSKFSTTHMSNSTPPTIPKPIDPNIYIRKKDPVVIPKYESLGGSWQGTNYDPYDRKQNRPDATSSNLGQGSVVGVKIKENMAAVPRKADGSGEGMLRMGTVIYVPELKQKILIADLLNERFNGQNKLDFAVPKSKRVPSKDHNKLFDNIVILRQGNGKEDLREFINSGKWKEELSKPYDN